MSDGPTTNTICDSNETSDVALPADQKQCEDETERGLYTLSGGTLCQLLKVQKKRADNNKLTASQRASASALHTCALQVVMTQMEKAACLPKELLHRDRGRMVFPKQSFLRFVNMVIGNTCQYLTESAMQCYGKKLLKVNNGWHFSTLF